MRATYSRFNLKVNLAVRRYRVARAALLVLDPGHYWRLQFKELKDEDNRGPTPDSDDEPVVHRSRFSKKRGEGYYQPSWIWKVGAENVPEEGDTLHASMRVEWARMLARAERWEEEEILVQEEMRRVVAFMEWKAENWRKLALKRTTGISFAMLSGLNAYAAKQAAMYDSLALKFVQLWFPVVQDEAIIQDWEKRYDRPVEKKKKGGKAKDRKKGNSDKDKK